MITRKIMLLSKRLGGRYKVLKHLGSGGYSQTYLAEDQHLPGQPLCVVKQLQPQAQDAFNLETARRLFTKEAQVLYQLGNHERIPRLFAHLEEHQEFYLVQEFIEGADLSQEFADGTPWAEEQVVAFLKEILQILAFVHQQGVIHRDIKPRNIMRDRNTSKLFLIDFGAVKQITTQVFHPDKQVTQTVVVGTPGYMSAEQMGGNPRFNSDIYAVGILAIQALTGLNPERNKFPQDPQTGEIVWRHRTCVSSELSEIVDRMVRYNHQDRYPSAEAVLENLQHLPGFRLTNHQATKTTQSFGTQQSPRHHSSAAAGIRVLPRSTQQRSLKPFYIGGMALAIAAILLGISRFLAPSAPNSTPTAIQNSPSPAAIRPPKPTKQVNRATALIMAGNKLSDAGNYQQALASYSKALKLQPKSAEAVWGYCNASNQLQRYKDAVRTCDYLLKLKPDDYRGWWGKGYALDKLQQYPDALRIYAQAARLKPDLYEVWSNAGAILHQQQRYADAIASYEQALKLKPDSPEVWNNRGAALHRVQRDDEALISLDKALKIKPDYPDAWNNRGNVLMSLKQVQDALAAYDRAIELQPDYLLAIQNRQQALRRLN